MNVPISQKVGRLPVSYEFSPESYRPLLLQRMKLYISGDRVLPGSSDTITPPKKNIGAWFRRNSSVATMTIASPAVVTWANHDLKPGERVWFTTTGALPTGVTAGNIYYVSSSGLTSGTFQFSSSPGGASINTSGTQSGVHTAHFIGSWWAWNDDTGEYEPIEIGVINGDHGITINAAPTEARAITLPNDTGDAIVLTDITIPKETVVLTSTGGTVSTVDANVSNNFILTLTENSTIPALTNMTSGSGKKIRIAIINQGTSYTVTWPSAGADAIKWPGGAPVQPVATATSPEAMAIYTITEANVGITPHLWGDPEVSGFSGPESIETGGEVPEAYIAPDTPPTKGRTPYNIP